MKYTYTTPWVSTEPRDTRQRQRLAKREAARVRLFRANPITSWGLLGERGPCLDKVEPRTPRQRLSRTVRRGLMRWEMKRQQ